MGGSGDTARAVKAEGAAGRASATPEADQNCAETSAAAERAAAKDAQKLEKEAGDAERVEGKAASRGTRAEAKGASKLGRLGKLAGHAANVIGGIGVVKDIKAGHALAAAKDTFDLVEPEIALARDALSWGWEKLTGKKSNGDDEAPKVPPEKPPLHKPIPGGHYLIVMPDGREIEVDAVALLNDGQANPIYPDEAFPGEANAEWRRKGSFKIRYQTDE